MSLSASAVQLKALTSDAFLLGILFRERMEQLGKLDLGYVFKHQDPVGKQLQQNHDSF
jgi:hypothetical protein